MPGNAGVLGTLGAAASTGAGPGSVAAAGSGAGPLPLGARGEPPSVAGATPGSPAMSAGEGLARRRRLLPSASPRGPSS